MTGTKRPHLCLNGRFKASQKQLGWPFDFLVSSKMLKVIGAVCVASSVLACIFSTSGQAEPQNTNQNLRARVAQHAASEGVPASVANAVVMLESRYRPHIVHSGNYGLMQIRYGTARSLGYRGSPAGLLNADTNLQYGMKYLARGWRASGGDLCRTIAHYQTGRLMRSIPASSQAYCSRAKRLIAQR
jgi:soluble lytic murein transglycosylase-like protein